MISAVIGLAGRGFLGNRLYAQMAQMAALFGASL